MGDQPRGFGFLQLDSPLIRFMGVVADLIVLNLLTLLLCIPVVTAGAAFTAMHYVLLRMVRGEESKMARGEESYIIKPFFHAFKENFRQATIIWIGMLVIYGMIFVDWRIVRMQGDQFSGILIILLYAVIIVVYLISLYIFPVLSRYRNTIAGTIKTAFSMSVFGMLTLRTLAAGVVYLLPLAILIVSGYPIVPIIIALCFTAPGLLRAKLYSGLFEKYEEPLNAPPVRAEEETEEPEEEEER